MSDRDCQHAGGGPLRGIIDDESRSDGERDFAASIVRLFKLRQSLHARTFELAPGVQLSFAQMKLLFHLPREGATSLSRFAEQAGITPGAATEALAPLEHAGLITRTRSTTDKRVTDIALSKTGRSALGSMRRDFAKRWDVVAGEFSERDLATAARVLEHVMPLFDLAARAPASR
jgi:DNA-binding MarR family transcriptional regulator